MKKLEKFAVSLHNVYQMIVLWLLLALALPVFPAAGDLFRTSIEPVLRSQCQGCHGTGQTLGKLDLRSREATLRGGARGPAIVPGNANASLMMAAIEGRQGLEMPPGGAEKRLPPETIAAFRTWIDAGAPWETGAPAEAKWTYKPEDLWAFQPVREPAIPLDAKNAIDRFVAAKWKEKAIQPAPVADKRTLLRRVSFDLTGLPPSRKEMDAFLADSRPDAWERVIDRLLQSPRYGERWGRHWLDVVRYADTSGYSNDFERPNAWRYRDYVIRSFNQDKPYNRLILEQIAGDELFPGDAEALIATGFLRAGPWEHTGMSVEAVTRQLFLDDVTHAVGATFLGLTVGCARCHDHKFDPIPTKDYYRLQAVFATTEFARPELQFLPQENTADLGAGRALMEKRIEQTRAKLAEFDEIVKNAVLSKHGVNRVEDLPPGILAEALKNKEGITPEQYEEMKLFQKHLQLYRESVDRFAPKAYAVSSGPLDGATDGGTTLKYPPRKEYEPPDVHILVGGNLQSPAEAVEPGVLSIVSRYSGLPEPQIPQSVEGRRAALARWVADPRNPLTARVMVNRIWQYHFGRGIAADTNNFGKMGAKPTHPELLDWLAEYFVRNGWSVKAVHKAILLSEAYRLSSAHPAVDELTRKDPENQLLARFTPRRLEAEELRDSILAVAGELSYETGGPGVFPQINEDVARQPRHAMGSVQPAYHPSPEKRLRNRRTIYTFQQRSLVHPMIEVFNGPSLDLSCERREASTVPTQAFALFNSQLLHDMSLALGARIEGQEQDANGRIARSFRAVLGRNPDPPEREAAVKHFERQLAYHRKTPAPAPPQPEPLVHTITSELTGEKFQFVQQEEPGTFEKNLHPSDVSPAARALADLALVLLNSNEFVYIY